MIPLTRISKYLQICFFSTLPKDIKPISQTETKITLAQTLIKDKLSSDSQAANNYKIQIQMQILGVLKAQG